MKLKGATSQLLSDQSYMDGQAMSYNFIAVIGVTIKVTIKV